MSRVSTPRRTSAIQTWVVAVTGSYLLTPIRKPSGDTRGDARTAGSPNVPVCRPARSYHSTRERRREPSNRSAPVAATETLPSPAK